MSKGCQVVIVGARVECGPNVLAEKSGPVMLVLINRPEVRNVVDPETAEALRDAFPAFEEDEDAAVAVLGRVGGCFCAGYDLKSLAGADRLVDEYDLDAEGPMGPSRMLLDKPVIAAVDGYAVAGGLELALWCDLRVVGTRQGRVHVRRSSWSREGPPASGEGGRRGIFHGDPRPRRAPPLRDPRFASPINQPENERLLGAGLADLGDA